MLCRSRTKFLKFYSNHLGSRRTPKICSCYRKADWKRSCMIFSFMLDHSLVHACMVRSYFKEDSQPHPLYIVILRKVYIRVFFLQLTWRHYCRWRGANFDLCSTLMQLSMEGSLRCHTKCNTGLPFIIFISPMTRSWHSHLLLNGWEWSCVMNAVTHTGKMERDVYIIGWFYFHDSVLVAFNLNSNQHINRLIL